MRSARNAVLIVLLTAANIFAAYPLSTDDAGIVSVGRYELEAGYDNCKDENELINKTCGISFKHGVTEKMDMGVSFPFLIEPSKEGRLGAAIMVVKFSIVKDIVSVTFSNELGEKDYFINTIYTKELPFFLCNFNLGYLSSGDDNEKGSSSYGFSLAHSFGKYETLGEIQGQEGGYGNWLLGLRRKINDRLFAAAGFSRTFESSSDKLSVGFHFEF